MSASMSPESRHKAWEKKIERTELRETIATMGSTVNPPTPDLVKEWYAKAKSYKEAENKHKAAKRRVEKRTAAARRQARSL